MTSNNGPSKMRGHLQEAQGTVKENVGKLFSDKMQAEGAAQKQAGTAEVTAAKTKAQARGAVDHMTGDLKNNAGKLIGNEQMQAEGKVKATAGQAQQKANEL